MTDTYLDFAATAFELMATLGLVLSMQEALDIAQAKVLHSHPADQVALARQQVETNLTQWNRPQ